MAFQAADYVGWNIWAAINRRPLLPFKYQHLGDMMALGTVDAAVAFPLDLTLDGAHVLRYPCRDVNGGVAAVSFAEEDESRCTVTLPQALLPQSLPTDNTSTVQWSAN